VWELGDDAFQDWVRWVTSAVHAETYRELVGRVVLPKDGGDAFEKVRLEALDRSDYGNIRRIVSKAGGDGARRLAGEVLEAIRGQLAVCRAREGRVKALTWL
jgi:hypothetical protein